VAVPKTPTVLDDTVLDEFFEDPAQDHMAALETAYPHREFCVAEPTIRTLFNNCFRDLHPEWSIDDVEQFFHKSRFRIVRAGMWAWRREGLLTRALVDDRVTTVEHLDISLAAVAAGDKDGVQYEILTKRPGEWRKIPGTRPVLYVGGNPRGDGQTDAPTSAPDADPSDGAHGDLGSGPQLTLMDGGLARRGAAA
jgi:hypothetical protein